MAAINALRFGALMVWVLLIAASLGWALGGVLAVLAMLVLTVTRLRSTAFGWRQGGAAALIVASALGSFGVQSELNSPAAALAEDINYETHEVRMLALEPATRGRQGSLRVAVRLLAVDGVRPACAVSLLPQDWCAPRGLAILDSDSWNSAVGARIITGATLEGRALLTPPDRIGRPAFLAKLKDPKLTTSSNWLASGLDNVHDAFTQSQQGISSQADALVAGIAIGKTDGLSDALKKAMQTTGLTHLTAVSGANCVIVAGLVFFMISRTRMTRLTRGLVTLSALGAYVLIVGQQPSVLRAAVMFACAMLPRLFGWRIHAIDSLAVAVLALLFFDPWLAVDFGFALSALATLGLVVAQKRIAELLHQRFGDHLPSWLSEASAVVLAAQLFCLPLILALSGALPTYTLLANLIVEPLVAPITVFGVLAVALAIPAPAVATALSWLASIPASWIVTAATYLAGLPLAQLNWLPGWLGVTASLSITALVTVAVVRRRLDRPIGIALALSAAFALAFGLAKPVVAVGWANSDWRVVACDVGQGDALVLRSQGKIAVVDVGREAASVDACLDSLGIATVDLLVLTHFDADHVGGLAGAIDGRTVEAALISPWPDERPMAAWAGSRVRQVAERVIQAEDGMTGRLGSFSWSVLNPSRTATEAEDSNDGSIAMLWRSPDINLLALADLGERGQQRLVAGHQTLLAEAGSAPLILKVAHHGSADCYQELYEELDATMALISVGVDNGYGHPTRRAMAALEFAGTRIYRTDQLGSIAIAARSGTLEVSVAGGG